VVPVIVTVGGTASRTTSHTSAPDAWPLVAAAEAETRRRDPGTALDG
jgi:hypothetical protein